jgi:hypothetical protein
MQLYAAVLRHDNGVSYHELISTCRISREPSSEKSALVLNRDRTQLLRTGADAAQQKILNPQDLTTTTATTPITRNFIVDNKE